MRTTYDRAVHREPPLQIFPFRLIVIPASDIRGVSETVTFRRTGESLGALPGPPGMRSIPSWVRA